MTEFTLNLATLKPVNSVPYPFTPLQLEWLNALESGSFKQGQGLLCSSGHEYCCLGVLAELSGAKRQYQAFRNAYRFSLPEENTIGGGFGLLTYGIRRLALLKSDMGEFWQAVAFPGLHYGTAQTQELAVMSGSEFISPNGHTSLASMNDVRMIPAKTGGWRAFTFKEIAGYIRHDPWNVFNPPEDLVQAAFQSPPLVEGAAYAET